MAPDHKHMAYLWRQYIAGKATSSELDELFGYIDNVGNDEENIRLFLEQMEQSGDQTTHSAFETEAWQNIRASIAPQQPAPAVHRVHFLRKWGWAAAVLIMAGIGTYFLVSKKENAIVQRTKPVPAVNDIAPGRDGAVLTLGDGSKVVLDSLRNGIVADQNGTQVVLQNGQLAYDPSDTPVEEVAYNTMSTPQGRQFKLALPDGTQVWLNAASSITYPTAFVGKERKVRVSGEVYFEVAKNAGMPFRVQVNNNTEIQVLGTSFNIKAYDNEPSIKTTLLEGAVRISAYQQLQNLIPGQQAQVNPSQKIKVISDPNIDQVMAWKNGLFNFQGYDVRSAMREIGRWYDLEIVYESEPDPGEIMGEMQRNLTLSQVMIVLKKLNINYRLEGKKLIVTR